MSEFKYIVTAEDVKRNLSVKQLVRNNFTFSSRLMTKLKQNHLVSLNGGDVQWWIAPVEGDVISILLPEEKSDFPPEDIPISAVYEDDDLLVINKQPGVVVHPTKGKPCHTIANGLMKKMLDEGKSCRVIVPDNQLSLAIGKEGQNARLAAKLTGYKIDIKPESEA